jgi:ferredoxin
VEAVALLPAPGEPNGIDLVGPTAAVDPRASLPVGLVSGYIEGMRVVVDFDLCESNALCMAAAPEVFEVRDDDFLYVLMDEPPEDLRDKVEAAARACPKVAITIVD